MKICTFDDCGRKNHAHGLCAVHCQQRAKGRPLTKILPYRGQRVTPATGPGTCCTIDGCEKPVHSGGWCAMHRWRWNTHGDTSHTSGRDLPMLDRFWMKVTKGPDCWNWTGGASAGYGQFTEGSKGKTHVAHRFSYELLVGPIPEGKLLDHRCRNTLCVRPDHLRPVTSKQNGEHRGGARRDSTTGVLGVFRIKRSGRYQATVTHHGKNVSGGQYDTLEEAAVAVKELRLSLYTHNDQDRRAG